MHVQQFGPQNPMESRFAPNFVPPRRTFLFAQPQLGAKVVGVAGPPVKKQFQQEPVEEKEDKKFYDEFLEITSIPGFSQIGRSKKRSGKIYWAFMFLAGIGLSMYQSSGLIQDYFKYITYQQSVLRMNATLQFPAVTVCNKSPVKWNSIRPDHPMKNEFNKLYEGFAAAGVKSKGRPLAPIEVRFVKEFALLQAMRTYRLSPGVTDVSDIHYNVSEVCGITRWNHVESVYGEEYLSFFHPYYGTCFTFNSGLRPGKPPIYVDPASDLIMAFFINRHDEPDFLVRTTGMAVLIHESGTPPILNSALVQQLYPGEWMKMSMNMQKITRLPDPYPSHCMDKYDMPARQSMVYYSQETPYLYSTEGCRTTCIQNRTFDLCKCLQTKIPYFDVPNLELCLKEENECNKDREQLQLDTCPCPLPCQEFMYRSQITYERFSMSDGYWREAAQFYFENLLDMMSDPNNATVLESHIAAIQVIFETVMYEDTSEQSKYSIADFWGAIGGNIGFWTGISVLSLIEVTELCAGGFMAFKKKSQLRGGHRGNAAPMAFPQNRYMW